jgi:S-adenosylmethionine synthetase
MRKTYLLTSESVSEGHPDKVADQVSDAILDDCLAKDPDARVACETMVTDGAVIVAGELFTKNKARGGPVENLARNVIRKIGYVDLRLGFDYRAFAFRNLMHAQSPNIGDCVARGRGGSIGAGDQGLMFGYAVNETQQLMPLPIRLAHRLVEEQAKARRSRDLHWLGPDAKSQVTVRYEEGKPVRVENVVLSTQHLPSVPNAEIETSVIECIIKKAIPEDLLSTVTQYIVNPSGRFEIGGPKADTGLTGRKIIADTYGGSCPHGGGAFSGKDPTKVDRSASYAARYIAKNLVAAGAADRCTVQLAYAIGRAEPVSVSINFHGSGKVGERRAAEAVCDIFDLTPTGIIKALNLKRPIYRKTSAYGHFGRELPGFTWEKTDWAAEIKRAFNI